MITAELLDTLERRYTPADQQKCVVCGAPLTFAASDRFGSKYVCSSDDASPLRSSKPRRERIDHWERSTWYDRSEGNMHVVALVQAYRELEPRAARTSFDEAAETRPLADAVVFAQEAAALDTVGFVTRTLGAARAAGNTGAGDRWEDPRDTTGGETDG